MDAATGKPAWRARLLAGRRGVPADERAAADAALCSWVAALSGTVCAYWAVGSEPGRGVPDALARNGCRVLLPVVRPDGPLAWGVHDGASALRPGPHGLSEPVASPGVTVTDADVVLVPALGVSRGGVRLGRGGGHYDRTLATLADRAAAGGDGSVVRGDGSTPSDPAARRPRLVAVVRDDELVDELPYEGHDVVVDEALTPSLGFVRLGP